MSYDPTLEDQLAQVGLLPGELPTAEQYWELLELVDAAYAHQRTLEVPSSGHGPLMEELLAALDEALASLARISRAAPPNPEAVDATRRQWSSRLHDVVALGREAAAEATLSTAASLGQSFDSLFEAMVTALSAEAEGGALNRELGAAARLVLPERDWLETGSIAVAAASQAAGVCSGDFWLAHRLAEHRTLIVVGDVTGHGAPSMVLAAGARAACALVAARPNPTVADFLDAMHRVIVEIGRSERMMTCVVALFDRRELSIANAGHRLPLHVKAHAHRGGPPETVPILARGAPLGAGPGVDVDLMKVDLGPGDLVLLYTDGVVETEDDAGERFTERRLRALLAEHVDTDPRITRDRLLTELATFRGRRPRTDDTTFVVTRIAASPAPPAMRGPQAAPTAS